MKLGIKLLLEPLTVFLVFCLLLPDLFASETQTTDWNVAVLDHLLASVQPGQTTMQVGDMIIPVSYVQSWREFLAGGQQANATFNGGFTPWTGGNVYYAFSNNVSAVKQQAFLDGMAEWAMFANLHFILHTNEANYVLIYEETAAEGGLSAVGMIGGEQTIQIAPNAWNRGTICHELGHTLGMVHEHQRSDRNNYVNILTNNIIPGDAGNFVLLSNSTNVTPYDFLSVMHYSRTNLSVSPLADVIDPLPAYTNFLNIMGQLSDPVLSASDRAGMASVYGAGPTITNIVTNTLDAGPGSLRAALYYAFDHPGTTITFDIPPTDPGFSNNVFNIVLTGAEPGLWYNTTLDASTEPTQSNPNGPSIMLNGAPAFSLSTFPNGLRFRGTNNLARSFVINGFPENGVLMDGTDAFGNTLAGCFIGTDPTGAIAVTNGICPVQISGGACSNTVGGATVAARNVIAGGVFQGISIRDPGTCFNTVAGNYIGLDAAGTNSLPDGFAGIEIFNGSQSNLIGGYTAAARNIISGNTLQGVLISGPITSGNIVAGNYIGLNPAGTKAIGNGSCGVNLFGNTTANVIGGTAPEAGNVISGNGSQGVLIQTNCSFNSIEGNYIGLNAAGTSAVSNGWAGVNFAGVEITSASQSNIVGGLTASARNVISGNVLQGILIDGNGTSGNLVQGNYFGLNPAGTEAISNGTEGVDIASGATMNYIGGTTSGAGNIISGNGYQGVEVQDSGTTGNNVEGNLIGLNAVGTAAIPNGLGGIGYAGLEITFGAQDNEIGGSIPGAGNVISGNFRQGVAIDDAGTTGNRVQGNLIGLNAAGDAAISNTWSGIEIFDSASGNLIGGYGQARNFISGNGNYGVRVDFANGNTIQGNTIGLNATNGAAIPNAFAGVIIYTACSNIIGGVFPGAANLISGSVSDGVQVFFTATNNTIRGNSIFANASLAIDNYSDGNNQLPSPTLASALVTTNTVVSGSYTGLSGNNYVIDFYSDASTESQTYLGSISVAGTGGAANFNASLGVHLPAGREVTATATDPAGNTSQLSAAVAATMTSTPNDGIPDAWRKLYFGGTGTTTNAQSDAFADADHTGLDNYEKFLAGLNPTNPASLFKLTALNPNTSTNVVSLGTSSGTIYRILFSGSLDAGYWSILADQVIGNGTNMYFYDPAAPVASPRFYRAEVLW